jgi:hypothetical protein
MNQNLERHDMMLRATFASGAEEWFCPTCGRRFIIQWSPKYKRITLEPGDDYALHNGENGGLRLKIVRMAQIQKDNDVVQDLGFWLDNLQDMTMDDL